jgi:XTP/dITP diphosphohydrolase
MDGIISPLVFATNNENKIKEIKEVLKNNFEILGLKDINCNVDLPETGTTLKDNALQKAQYIYDKFNINCFADDTGLEVEALNGAPGVYSARYAGPDKSAEDNMNLLLKKLEGVENRNARFVTVIALIINGKKYFFEGEVKGVITKTKCGNKGFGYDPVFKPDGYDCTFAEMTLEEKNKISHRAIAMKKLVNFIKNSKK